MTKFYKFIKFYFLKQKKLKNLNLNFTFIGFLHKKSKKLNFHTQGSSYNGIFIKKINIIVKKCVIFDTLFQIKNDTLN